jgi:hypothetical protein
MLVVRDGPVEWIPQKRERAQFAPQITVEIPVEMPAVHGVLVELVFRSLKQHAPEKVWTYQVLIAANL